MELRNIKLLGKEIWKQGGAAPWNGVTYDPDTNLVFVPTGNPAPWNYI